MSIRSCTKTLYDAVKKETSGGELQNYLVSSVIFSDHVCFFITIPHCFLFQTTKKALLALIGDA